MILIGSNHTKERPVSKPGPEEFGRRQLSWTLSDAYYVALHVIGYIGTIFLIGWLFIVGAQGFGYNWQWYRVPSFLFRIIDGEFYFGPLIRGLFVTLEISFYSLTLAMLLGLVGAILRLSQSRIGNIVGMLYVEIIRNMPLLIQMYLFYFVLAQILKIDRFPSAVWCLATFQGAYLTEIFRAGIQSVPKGQWEAAFSLGLRNAVTLWKIILPQAIRLIIPPLTNQAISLVKQSAIVSVIAVFDLATEGRNIIADTFMTFEIWLTVALIYFLITTLLSIVAERIEYMVRR